MPSNEIIYIFIGCLVVLALFIFFSRHLKFIARALVSSALGAIGMVVCNSVFAGFGAYVGVNLLTLLIVAVLGLPGFVLLYVTSFIL